MDGVWEALEYLIIAIMLLIMGIGCSLYIKFWDKQNYKEKAREKALQEGRYDELLADKSYSYSIKEKKVHRHEFVVSSEKARKQPDNCVSPTYKNQYVESYYTTQRQLPMHLQEKLAVANMYIDKIYGHDPEDKFFKRYLPLVTETLQASVSAENSEEVGNTASMLSDAAKQYYAQITGKSMMTVDVNKSVLEQLLIQDGLYNPLDDPVIRMASVTFPGSDKQYDYICESDTIQSGDRVVVEANGNELEVTAAEIKQIPRSKLELPVGRYKPVVRKA